MTRLSVFLSDQLLARIGEEAGREKTSRSALVRKAATHYLKRATKEREEAERRVQMLEACRRMDELAEKLGEWDPAKIIRRARKAGPQYA